MESHDASFEFVIPPVISAHLLGKEFFPAVAWFRIGGMGIFLPQRRHVGALLVALSIDAGRGREEELLHTTGFAGLKHMNVYERVVACNVSKIGCYVANAPHVGSQVVHFIYAASCVYTIFPLA